MAQHFDVSLKTLFRYSRGVVSRLLFGGPVVEWLNVEQPDVRNVRVDMLARLADGSLRHVEFQTSNETDMARRQAEYYLGFWRLLGEHVEQVMLYVGRDPLGMDAAFETRSMRYAYTVFDVREFDGEELCQSEDWVDNELALFTKVDRERVFRVVSKRLLELRGDEQTEAVRCFVILSGILGIEEEVERRLRTDMINLLDNKILGPAILKGLEQGREEGRQALLTAVKSLTRKRFGNLPNWAVAKLEAANMAQLEA